MSVDDSEPPWAEDSEPLIYTLPLLTFGRKIKKIGVAVSGGSDSMAALHLACLYARTVGWSIQAVTVDHGIRAAAKDEAAFVGRACAILGVAHTILEWHRQSTSGNLQDQAARARYRLMTAWAKECGIDAMIVAHTADDLAETFMMRLARKSGLDGLSGMRRDWTEDGVFWLRPYLHIRRAELRAFLVRHHIPWVDDPSNEDLRFDRVKARHALMHLSPLGIDANNLVQVAALLDDARDALVQIVHETAQVVVRQEAGNLIFDWSALTEQPFEIVRRLFVAALKWISGSVYPPRREDVNFVIMATGGDSTKTLSGCIITCKGSVVTFMREHNAVRSLVGPTDQPWDNRWHLTGPHDPTFEIRALGETGIRLCPDWRATGMPRQSLLASPAIWRGETLIAAPLAGKPEGWTARIATDFHASLVSH